LRLALAKARGKAEGDMLEMARSARLGKLLELAENWKKPQFPINGTDVMGAGVSAGKQVGETLSALENFWIEENFSPDRAALLARLNDLTK
jgi:poly(A) polymerase